MSGSTGLYGRRESIQSYQPLPSLRAIISFYRKGLVTTERLAGTILTYKMHNTSLLQNNIFAKQPVPDREAVSNVAPWGFTGTFSIPPALVELQASYRQVAGEQTRSRVMAAACTVFGGWRSCSSTPLVGRRMVTLKGRFSLVNSEPLQVVIRFRPAC